MRLDWGGATFLKKKRVAVAGLDIGTTGVRLVELSHAGDEIQLEHFAYEPLPRGAIVDGNIENLEQVAEAVRRVWKKSGARAKQVALAMPAAFVITRKIILPADLSEDQLEFQVENEASHYIASAPEEVRLDFAVLGPLENAPQDIEVLFAAARKEKVEDRVAVVEEAALTPKIMDVETFATRAALARVLVVTGNAPSQEIVALFQIGAHQLQMLVLQSNQLVCERVQAFGGYQLTQEIVQAYDIPWEEAERRKKSGDLPHGYEATLLEPFLEMAAQEIERALQFLFSSTPHAHVDRLVLAGGGALLPSMVEAIRQKTGSPTELVNPFQGMRYASAVRERQLVLEAPAYLTACGLALHSGEA